MSRLAFVLPNMAGGGAARVAAILSGEWSAMNHDVHLITFEEPGAASAYSLAKVISRHQIGLAVSPRTIVGFATNNAQRIVRLRTTLNSIRPDAVVAFLLEANVSAVMASRGLGVPVLISERNHPKYHKISPLRGRLRKLVYPFASRLCVQTDEIRRWFAEHLRIEACVIPNPVLIPERLESSAPIGETRKRKRAVSLGRLEAQKGFDILIDAFALVCNDASQWDLAIFGDGSERAALEQRIDAHGLRGRIRLLGHTPSIAEELAGADLYVHSARYEGFPNAVIEALAAGRCVVATDCPGATGEILQHGRCGVLVSHSNTIALAEGMLGVMKNGCLLKSFELKARNSVAHLDAHIIAKQWLNQIAL